MSITPTDIMDFLRVLFICILGRILASLARDWFILFFSIFEVILSCIFGRALSVIIVFKILRLFLTSSHTFSPCVTLSPLLFCLHLLIGSTFAINF